MLTNQLVEKFNISPSSPSPPSLFIILSVLCHHFPSVVFYKSGFSQESRSSRCCVLGTEHTLQGAGLTQALGGLEEDCSGTLSTEVAATDLCLPQRSAALLGSLQGSCCHSQESQGSLTSISSAVVEQVLYKSSLQSFCKFHICLHLAAVSRE